MLTLQSKISFGLGRTLQQLHVQPWIHTFRTINEIPLLGSTQLQGGFSVSSMVLAVQVLINDIKGLAYSEL